MSETNDSSVTLAWTEVDDGRGSPASYEIRYALTPLGTGWADATIVVAGDCALPMKGSAVGATISCTVGGLDPDTSYDFQLAAFWTHPNKTKMYGDERSNVATATTTTTTEEVPIANPSSVTNLSVTGTTESSVMLAWTEADDGAGSPASYEVRYALTPIGHGWGGATTVAAGGCGSPVTGSDVGATISCAVGGLDSATGYDFQLVAFRDEEDGSRVYSDELSNVATATTMTEVVPIANPSNVTNLSATGTTESSVTLAWREVDDGAGSPASYEVRYTLTPLGHGWGDATTVVAGDCASPITGREVGAAISCTVGGLNPATGYDFQLVAFRDEEDGSRVYSDGLSNVATATTMTEVVPIANPSNVTDLSATGTTESSVTLAWTEADDGAGSPASYQVRYALTPIGHGWGGATTVAAGGCGSPVTGSDVGATISCAVGGLDPATGYDFQLVAFRDEEDGTRVYSDGLSNVASATTEGAITTTNSPEPAGFSVLAETTYSSANEGGFRSSVNENFAIVEDAGAPRSPSTVARATFPAGLGDGVSPIWSEAVISSHSAREVYVSFWVKISDNWQGHSTGVNKVAIIWTHEKPVVVATILGAGDGWLGSEIRIQDVPDGARNLAPNLTNPEIVRDRWHHWEILLVSNVQDAADGEVHWWVDGNKVGAYADVRFGSASQSKIWNYVNWRPVWGGRGDVIKETQYMWMDHYYVSGKQ